MNRNRNGRVAAQSRLQAVLLALLLALFGAPALAQESAQQEDTQQQDSVQQDAGAEATGDQTVIQLGPDDEITEAEFEQEFERATRAVALRQGLPYNEQTQQMFERFRADFLDQLATRNALLLEAQARGISVSEEEVEQQLTQVQENLGEEQFQQAVQDLGFDSVEAYRESVREGLITQQVIEEMSAGVEVSDEEIQTFYDENQDLFAGQELDQVREQVRAELVNQRLTEQFADLQQQHGIETFPERIAVAGGQEEGVAGGGEAAGAEGEAGGAEGDADPDVVQPDNDAPSSEEDGEPGEVPAVEDVEGDRENEPADDQAVDQTDDEQEDAQEDQ